MNPSRKNQPVWLQQYNSKPKKPFEKRPMGRPSILAEGMTLAQMIEAYERHKTARRAAKALGISDRALRKYLAAAGYKLEHTMPPAGPTLETQNSGRLPALLLWAAANPTKKLPRSVRGIANKTGLKYACIQSFLKGRQQRLRRWLLSLGDLLETKSVIQDTTGRRVPVDALSSYSMQVDRFDLSVDLLMFVKFGGAVRAKIPWETYIGFFGKKPKDAPWASRKLSKEVPSEPLHYEPKGDNE